jgi:outer membrane protein assembly factor BamB
MVFSTINRGQVEFLFFLMFKQFTIYPAVLICMLAVYPQVPETVPTLVAGWRFESSELTDFKPVLSSEGLVVSLLAGKVVLLDTESGSILWTNESAGEITSEPIVRDSFVFVSRMLTDADKSRQTLTTISLKTGLTVKTEPSVLSSDSTEIDQPIKNASDNVFQLSSDSEIFIAQNTVHRKVKGRIIWRAKLGGKINNIEANIYGFLVSSDDNYLYLLNPKNGNKVWKNRFSGKVLGTISVNEKVGVVTVYGENSLQLFDIQKGRLLSSLKFGTDEYPFSSLIRKAGQFYIGTNRGVRRFSLR